LKKKTLKIRYSQCWEDSELMLEALDLKPEDSVVSISSGGCNSLAIAGCLPERVYSVDNNPIQNYLLQLKFIAIQHLQYEDCLQFIGIKQCSSRKIIFEKICHYLEPLCKAFWEEHLELIELGIIHSGNFEKYMNCFTKYILPFVQSKKTVDIILHTTDKDEQKKLFQNRWNNLRWRLFVNIFLSKPIMQLKGRSREMFTHNQTQNTGKVYLERTKKAISEGIVNQNPYLEYILKGNYFKTLPYYLKPKVFSKLKEVKNITIINSDLLNFLNTLPDNSISKYNLSDVFESLNESETAYIFEQILRTSAKNARLIFWNNLVLRDVPPQLKSYFTPIGELENKLRPMEKVFFYAKFYIYTINK
jgi:S-adenosylmethionine-diacylglycerol 3-amino-3-carboxypropyl transferase